MQTTTTVKDRDTHTGSNIGGRVDASMVCSGNCTGIGYNGATVTVTKPNGNTETQAQPGQKQGGVWQTVKSTWSFLTGSAEQDQADKCFPNGCSAEQMSRIGSDAKLRNGVNTVLALLPGAVEEAIAAHLTATLTMSVVESGSSGVWELGPGLRGEALEKALGQNLPQNFPTIDRFSNGEATSIKTIDLRASTYQKESALKKLVVGYVDKLAAFNGTSPRGWANVRINPNEITKKVLDIAVPGQGSAMQQSVMQNAAKYAQSVGVHLNVIVVH